MDRHIISTDASILEALHRLNDLSGGVMTLFVIEPSGRLVGSLTDGDIRRGLMNGHLPSDPVHTVMHRDFKALRPESPEVEEIRKFRTAGVKLIPRIDADGRLTEIIDTTITHTHLPLSAIMMAGGKGERLRPLTLTTPKPLLKVGPKAIIDYNVTALARCGITDISVTVNYLADQLEQHFAKPIDGVHVKCVREDRFLGTIGAAALVPLPETGSTIVMNSDLLTNVSFEEMFLMHTAEQADITIGAIPYKISVPYAILQTDGTEVRALEEKPSYSWYANAGVYIINNSLLRNLPRDTRTDATDLIESAIAENRKVVYFPITGMWIDIGSPADFRRANELIEHASLL